MIWSFTPAVRQFPARLALLPACEAARRGAGGVSAPGTGWSSSPAAPGEGGSGAPAAGWVLEPRDAYQATLHNDRQVRPVVLSHPSPVVSVKVTETAGGQAETVGGDGGPAGGTAGGDRKNRHGWEKDVGRRKRSDEEWREALEKRS